jgi:hypothetical protein
MPSLKPADCCVGLAMKTAFGEKRTFLVPREASAVLAEAEEEEE